MKELPLENYYSAADKKRDSEAISLFFNKERAKYKHLDGTRMIN
jgi:hypothetical protein